MYVQCNFEARSPKRCCNGKVVSVTYCASVCVNVGIQHAIEKCHISICGLPSSTIGESRLLWGGFFFKKLLLN